MCSLMRRNSFTKVSFFIETITSVSKNGGKNQKGNYRPVSIRPTISKIFEKISSKQLYDYFENILSKFQSGFRKGSNNNTTHNSLLLTIENGKWM